MWLKPQNYKLFSSVR